MIIARAGVAPLTLALSTKERNAGLAAAAASTDVVAEKPGETERVPVVAVVLVFGAPAEGGTAGLSGTSSPAAAASTRDWPLSRRAFIASLAFWTASPGALAI